MLLQVFGVGFAGCEAGVEDDGFLVLEELALAFY